MATLSVPITAAQENFIDSLIKSGKAANKAHAIRMALDRFAEEEAVAAVLASEQEIREGKVFKGDLREFLKKDI